MNKDFEKIWKYGYTGLLFGGDPEFWVYDKSGNLILPTLPPFEFVKPKHPYREYYEHCYAPKKGYKNLSRDGLAIEVGINPDFCRDRLVPDFAHTLSKLVKEFDVGYISSWPTASINSLPEQVQASLPPDVLISGCDADVNAYNGRLCNVRPYDDNMRYIGGHIHIGETYTNVLTKNREDVVKHLDAYVTIPIMYGFLDNTKLMKAERQRRRYYGRAGSYRPTDYGLEYRVLSSHMLTSHPVLMRTVIMLARNIFCIKSELPDRKKVIKAINKVDEELIADIFENDLDFSYGNYENLMLADDDLLNTVMKLIRHKAFSIIDDDIISNWALKESRFIDHAYIDFFSLQEGHLLEWDDNAYDEDGYCYQCNEPYDCCYCDNEHIKIDIRFADEWNDILRRR